jgi:hypothetical protein
LITFLLIDFSPICGTGSCIVATIFLLAIKGKIGRRRAEIVSKCITSKLFVIKYFKTILSVLLLSKPIIHMRFPKYDQYIVEDALSPLLL